MKERKSMGDWEKYIVQNNLKNKYVKKNTNEERNQDEPNLNTNTKDDENNFKVKERISINNKQNNNNEKSNIYEIYSKSTCKDSNISSLDNEDINKNETHNQKML